MSATPNLRRRRGQPLAVVVEVETGDPTGVTCEAVLKRTKSGYLPAAAEPAAATFTVAFEAAAGDQPARWLLTLSAGQTAALLPGIYVTDAALLLAGQPVLITPPIFIQLDQSVSG